MIHSTPEFIDITPEMQERLDRFREEQKNDPVGDVGSQILFEDDRVRIWQLVLEPGDASDFHRHDHDYYLVISEGDLVAGVTPEGSGMDSFIGKVPDIGNTVCVPKGGVEWAYNVGKKTYREVIFELKDT